MERDIINLIVVGDEFKNGKQNVCFQSLIVGAKLGAKFISGLALYTSAAKGEDILSLWVSQ